jgi:hypothetical protein
MTDEPKRPRSRRIYVLWGVALTLLLALGLLCWLVVPFMRVRSKLDDEKNYSKGRLTLGIEAFGGPDEALSGLSIYYRMPRALAPRKYSAVDLLTDCGPRAVPVLRQALRDSNAHVRHRAICGLLKHDASEARTEIVTVLLRDTKHKDPEIRSWAASYLGRLHPAPPGVVKTLIGMLDDGGEWFFPSCSKEQRPQKVRDWAISALAALRGEAREAVPRLRSVAEDKREDAETRKAAAEALDKIKSAEAAKASR